MTDLFHFPGGNRRDVWVMSAYDGLGSLLSVVVSLMAWGPGNSNPYVEDFFIDVEWEEGICPLPMSKLARWNRMQPFTPTPSLQCQLVGGIACNDRKMIFCSFEH